MSTCGPLQRCSTAPPALRGFGVRRDAPLARLQPPAPAPGPHAVPVSPPSRPGPPRKGVPAVARVAVPLGAAQEVAAGAVWRRRLSSI